MKWTCYSIFILSCHFHDINILNWNYWKYILHAKDASVVLILGWSFLFKRVASPDAAVWVPHSAGGPGDNTAELPWGRPWLSPRPHVCIPVLIVCIQYSLSLLIAAGWEQPLEFSWQCYLQKLSVSLKIWSGLILYLIQLNLDTRVIFFKYQVHCIQKVVTVFWFWVFLFLFWQIRYTHY